MIVRWTADWICVSVLVESATYEAKAKSESVTTVQVRVRVRVTTLRVRVRVRVTNWKNNGVFWGTDLTLFKKSCNQPINTISQPLNNLIKSTNYSNLSIWENWKKQAINAELEAKKWRFYLYDWVLFEHLDKITSIKC